MKDEIFEEIFQMIIDSGLYSFNKSHAVAYAIMCYMTAYYKINYPLEYMAAELSNIYNSVAADKRKDRIAETVKECRRIGIKFLDPDINKSKWKFTVEDNKIRIGLCAISSFGDKAYNALEECEELVENRDLETIYNNVNKTVFNKKAFNALIFAGAFGDRTTAYHTYCDLRGEEPVDEIVFHKNLKLNVYDDDKEMEEGLLGYNFIHSAINSLPSCGYKSLKHKANFECQAIITRVKKNKINNGKNKGKTMAFLTIETGDGTLDVVVFHNVLEKYKSYLKKNNMINFKGTKDTDEECIMLGAY